MAEPGQGAARPDVTCVLVDDHETVRSSLASLLEQEGIEVAGEASDVAGTRALFESVRPVLAVIDYSLPDGTGIDIARIVAEVSPETRLVLYTGAAQASVVHDAFEAGIRAVALKDVPPKHLVDAVHAVLAGETYVDPRI